MVTASTALLVLGLAPARAAAQAATGVIVGSVTDPQKAVVPGATILVTNVATGVNNLANTDNDGHFEVDNLPIGNYSVTVTHPGFQKTTTQAQTLQINQTLRFAISLPLGATNQTVTV